MNKIAITGDIEGMTRKEVIATIQNKGYQYTTSVNIDTDALIVGSKPCSKINKAKYVGAEIISQDHFFKLFVEGFLS